MAAGIASKHIGDSEFGGEKVLAEQGGTVRRVWMVARLQDGSCVDSKTPLTNSTLDLARIISALAIFYYHVGLYVNLPISRYGEYAVATFLWLAIVSAVTFSLPKGDEELGACSYLAARFRRLIPLYLCVNVFVFAASFVISSRLGRPFTFVEFLLSAATLSQYFGLRYLSTVFWFVPFIIQVYILIAFGHRLIPRLGNWWWLPIAFLLSCGEILVVKACFADPAEVLRNWSPLLRPTETLLGIQGGLWFTGKLCNRAFAARVACFGALSGLLALAGRHDQGLAYIYTLPLNGLMVTVVLLGCAWLLSLVAPERFTRLLRRLGRATYAFFLIHAIAIVSIYHRFGSSPLVWIGYTLCCVGMALAMDAIFTPRRRTEKSVR